MLHSSVSPAILENLSRIKETFEAIEQKLKKSSTNEQPHADTYD